MTYKITAEVDEQWFNILGQITKHQEGFVWIDVKPTMGVQVTSNGIEYWGDML